MRVKQRKFIHKFLSGLVVLTFLSTTIIPPAHAQTIGPLNLPLPGTLVPVSPLYTPALIKGITIHPENPLHFDFIVDTGNSQIAGEELKEESIRLIKYFLASLTVPEKDLWVNLSPYEKDRIIPESFGLTEMGRDLLAQDYILKQLTASLTYPENDLGKDFWERVFSKAKAKYGNIEIPMNTFNKVWIIPDRAEVYEHGNTAFVTESHFKVMLAEDYLALQESKGDLTSGLSPEEKRAVNEISSEVVREILIPEIEKEVNEGKNFANLRQIGNSMILATWFKQTLRETLLGKIYIDQSRINGVDVEDRDAKEKIYQQYLEAFKKGVYNYIKEDYDPEAQQVLPRQYFSGGTIMQYSSVTRVVKAEQGNPAMLAPKVQARGEHVRLAVRLVESSQEAAAVSDQLEEVQVPSNQAMLASSFLDDIRTGITQKLDFLNDKIFGLSIDNKDVDAVRGIVADEAERVKIFSASEISHADSQPDPLVSYAARLAAKHAVLEALGIQERTAEKLKGVQILSAPSGEPSVRLEQSLRQEAGLDSQATVLISLTHDGGQALAFALVLKEKSSELVRLGIDLSLVDRFTDAYLKPIVRTYAFTTSEQEAAQRDAANAAGNLATSWSLKESIAKALGGQLHSTAFRDIDAAQENVQISDAMRRYFGIESAAISSISRSAEGYAFAATVIHGGRQADFGAISGAFKPEVNRPESTLESIKEIGRVKMVTGNPINDEPYQQLNQLRTINPHVDSLIAALNNENIEIRIVEPDPIKVQALQQDQESQGEADSLAAFEAEVTSDLGFLTALVDPSVYHGLLSAAEDVLSETLPFDVRGVLLINRELIQALDAFSLARLKVLEAELANALVQSENPASSLLVRDDENSLALQAAAVLNEARILMGVEESLRSAISEELPQISPNSPLDEGIFQLARDFSLDSSLYTREGGFTDSAIGQTIAFIQEHYPDLVQTKETDRTIELVRSHLIKAAELDREGQKTRTRVANPDYEKTPALRYKQRSHLVVSAGNMDAVRQAVASKADLIVIDLGGAQDAELRVLTGFLNSQDAALRKFDSKSPNAPGIILSLSSNWKNEVEQVITRVYPRLRGVQFNVNEEEEAVSTENIYDLDASLIRLELERSLTVGTLGLWLKFEDAQPAYGVKLNALPRIAGVIGDQQVALLAQTANLPAIAKSGAEISVLKSQGYQGAEISVITDVDTINSDLIPSADEIKGALERAETFLQAHKQGEGVVVLDDTVLDIDTLRRDMRFLIFAERVDAIQPSSDERMRLDLLRWRTLYDAQIPFEIEVPETTLPELLQNARNQRPDAELVYIIGYEQNERGELNARKKVFKSSWLGAQAVRFANALAARGVKKSDGVAIMLPNSPQYEIAVEALGYIGAVDTSPDIFYSPQQIETRMIPYNVTTIITLDTMKEKVEKVLESYQQLREGFDRLETMEEGKLKERFREEMEERIKPFGRSLEEMKQVVRASEGIKLAVVTSIDDLFGEESTVGEETIGDLATVKFKDMLSQGSDQRPEITVGRDDVIKLQFTSGRGGKVKAAVHTHSTIMSLLATQGIISVPEAGRPTTILAPLVMSHTFGLATNLAGIMRGARRIMIPNVDPEMFLETVFYTLIEEQVTEFFATPSSLTALINFLKVRPNAREELKNLRAIHVSGGKLNPSVERELNQIFGRQVTLERLGMSEYPSFSMQPRSNRRFGTVGVPGPGATMKIVSLEEIIEDDQRIEVGDELRPFQSGEIIIQGPSRTVGYYADENATADAIREGWLHTGDMGYIDSEGRIYYVGVAKDVIKIRDFTVSPDEVENALTSIPGIREAVVVPIKDKSGATTGIRAAVVLEPGSKLTARKIRRMMQARVSPLEVPSEIVGASHIEKTPGLGKLIRRGWVTKQLQRGSVEDVKRFDPQHSALLIPPAGYHFKGMGQDLYELDASVAAAYRRDNVFVTQLFAQNWVDANVTALAGQSIQLDTIAFSDPQGLLSRVEKTDEGWQWKGDFVVSVMAMIEHQLNLVDLYKKRFGQPGAIAGESLGWPAALYASGALGREDALKLAFESAYAIKAASDVAKYQMAIILGVSDAKLKRILKELNGSISVDESNKLVIVNVPTEKLKQLETDVKKAKGKMIVSNIPVASHTKALRTDATQAIWDRYENYIRTEFRSALKKPSVPIASTVESGKLLTTVEEIVEHDIASHFNPVLWRDAVRNLESGRAESSTFIQVGGPSAFTLEHQVTNRVISEDARGLHLSRLGHLDLVDKPSVQSYTGTPVTIDQLAIDAEAFASGDRNLFHLDDAFAFTSRYGEKIAHGVLSQSYVMQFLGQLFPDWKVIDSTVPDFLTPVRAGHEIRPVVTIKTVEGQRMLVEYSALNQWNDILFRGTAILKLHSGAADAAVARPSVTDPSALRAIVADVTKGIKAFELRPAPDFQEGVPYEASYETVLSQDVVDAYSYLFGNRNASLDSIIGLGLMSFASSQFAPPPYVLTGAGVFDFQEIVKLNADTLKTFPDKNALSEALGSADILTMDDLLQALPFAKQRDRDRFRQKFSASMVQALERALANREYRSILVQLLEGKTVEWKKPQVGDRLSVKASLYDVKILGSGEEQKRQIAFDVEVLDAEGRIVYMGRIFKQELDPVVIPEGEIKELTLTEEERNLQRLISKFANQRQQAIFPADNPRMREGAAEDERVQTNVYDHEDAMSPVKRITERANTAELFNKMRLHTPDGRLKKLSLVNWLRSYRQFKDELQPQDREMIKQLLLDPDIETPEDFIDALSFDEETRKTGWGKQLIPAVRETFVWYLENAAHRRALVESMEEIDTHDKLQVARINNGRTVWAAGDILYLIGGMNEPPDAIFLPKTVSPNDIRELDRWVTPLENSKGWKPGSIRFMVLKEYTTALQQIDEIIEASPRVIMAEFGLVDFVAANRARNQHIQWRLQLFGKRRVVEAARKYNIIAGDGITPAIAVDQALRDALRAALMFHLKWNVNPRHGDAIAQVVFEPADLKLREHKGGAQFEEGPYSLEELKRRADNNIPLIGADPIIERRHIALNRVGQYVNAGDAQAVAQAFANPQVENIYLKISGEVDWTKIEKDVLAAKAQGPKEVFVVVDGSRAAMEQQIGQVYAQFPSVDAFVISGTEYKTRDDIQAISDLLDDLEGEQIAKDHATDIILAVSTGEQMSQLYYYDKAKKTSDGMTLVTRRDKPDSSRVTALINQLPENTSSDFFKGIKTFYDALRKDDPAANAEGGFRSKLREKLAQLDPESQEAEWLRRQIDFDFFDAQGKEAPRNPEEAARLDQMGALLNAASAAGIDAIYDGRHVAQGELTADSATAADMGYYGWIVENDAQVGAAFNSMTLSRDWVDEALDVAEVFHAALYRDKKGAVPFDFKAGLSEVVRGLDDEATSKIYRGSFEPEERIRARGILDRALELGLLNQDDLVRYHMYSLPQLWENGEPVVFSTKRWPTLWEFIPGSDFKRIRHKENHSITATLNENTQRWAMDRDVFMEVADRLAHVTFERPDRSNKITRTTWQQLEQAITEALADDRVGAMVLTGSYEVFSQGDDLTDPPTEEQIERVVRLIKESRKPIVAAIDGHIAGSALALALAAHKRIATNKIVFEHPLTEGAVVSNEMIYQLPRLVGIREALEFFLGQRTIQKNEADSWGLVDEIVRDPAPRSGKLTIDVVIQRAQAIASELASRKIAREERKWDEIEFRQTEDSLSVFSTSGREVLNNEDNRAINEMMDGLREEGYGNAIQSLVQRMGQSYVQGNRDISKILGRLPASAFTASSDVVKVWVKANDTGMQPFFDGIVPGPVFVNRIISDLSNFLPNTARVSHSLRYKISIRQGETLNVLQPQVVQQDEDRIELLYKISVNREGESVQAAELTVVLRPKTRAEARISSSVIDAMRNVTDNVEQEMMAWGQDAALLSAPEEIPQYNVGDGLRVDQEITIEHLRASLAAAGKSQAIQDVITGNVIAKAITHLTPKGFVGGELVIGELQRSIDLGDTLTARITVADKRKTRDQRDLYRLEIGVSNQRSEDVMSGSVMMFSLAKNAAMLSSRQTDNDPVGGINFNPELMDLQIKRNSQGVPLPLPQQTIDSIKIDGLLPVIINVAPVTNLPLLLGIAEPDTRKDFSKKGNGKVDSLYVQR